MIALQLRTSWIFAILETQRASSMSMSKNVRTVKTLKNIQYITLVSSVYKVMVQLSNFRMA